MAQSLKNFLTDSQIEELQKKDWKVQPKCFRVTLYIDDFSCSGWSSICKIAGVSENSTQLTVLSIGTISEM